MPWPSEQESTALLLDAGYRRGFSLVELELPDLRHRPSEGPLAAVLRIGAIGPSDYRAACKTVVDAYADAAFTQRRTPESYLATAEPTCRVALPPSQLSQRRQQLLLRPPEKRLLVAAADLDECDLGEPDIGHGRTPPPA